MTRPPLPKIAGLLFVLLAFCAHARASGGFDSINTPVMRGNALNATGWAYADSVRIVVDGYYYYDASYNGYNWSISLNSSEFSNGSHTMTAYAITTTWDYDYYYEQYVQNENWEWIGERGFTVQAQPPPATVSASGTNIVLGQSTTLSGSATAPNGNLETLHFYVSGPSMPGWNYVGSTGISGAACTGSMTWRPVAPGNWSVQIRAVAGGEWDTTSPGVTGGFFVDEPIVRLPSSSQYVVPSGELTIVHVGDTVENSASYTYWVTTNNEGGDYGYWVTEYGGDMFRWNGSDWAYHGFGTSLDAQTPGLYRVNEMLVLVLTPSGQPSCSFTASSTTISLGQSTVLTMSNCTAGSHDYLSETTIDMPLNSSLFGPSPGNSTSKTYTFTPTVPGTYTFYARIATGYYNWATYGTVTVTVNNTYPTNSLSVPSQVNVGQGYAASYSATNPTAISSYQIGFKLWVRHEDASGNPLSGWGEPLAASNLTSGNKTWSKTDCVAPSSPGRLHFRYYSWNQWPDGNEQVYNQSDAYVPVVNRAPTVTISPSSTQTINYGQSVAFSSTATDPDGNLASHTWNYTQPGAVESSPSNTVSGSSVTRNDTLAPHSVTSGTIIGNWTVRYTTADALGLTATSTTTTVTVAKATPSGSYADRTMAEGTELPVGYLNAVFSNPHNSSLSVPGSITYTIISGVAPYGNGRVLTGREVLPAGTYTIQASIVGSTHYNAGSVSATLYVSPDPTADNDSDGLTNGVEEELGTNKNSVGQNSPSSLELKIHTPRP